MRLVSASAECLRCMMGVHDGMQRLNEGEGRTGLGGGGVGGGGMGGVGSVGRDDIRLHSCAEPGESGGHHAPP